MGYDYDEYAEGCHEECDGKCDLHTEALEGSEPTA